MNRSKYMLFLLSCTLIFLHRGLDAKHKDDQGQRKYEPKAIMAYQRSQNQKQKRQYMNERLALIDLRLRNLEEDATAPQEALAHLQSKVTQLKSALGISAEIDPYLLLGPLERAVHDKKQRALQIAKHGAKRLSMISKMKKLAATKSRLNQRRKRS